MCPPARRRRVCTQPVLCAQPVLFRRVCWPKPCAEPQSSTPVSCFYSGASPPVFPQSPDRLRRPTSSQSRSFRDASSTTKTRKFEAQAHQPLSLDLRQLALRLRAVSRFAAPMRINAMKIADVKIKRRIVVSSVAHYIFAYVVVPPLA